jgi:predicted deacylase
VRADALPLTYDECRARFRRAAADAALAVEAHPIEARGPHGQELTVDVVRAGAPDPDRVLVVLSGVHGVEGFACSAIQCDLLGRLDVSAMPPATAVVAVHAVNPWGMAWWRRQNESNVDLNRNWGRDHAAPMPNAAYRAVHPLLCPDDDQLPDDRSFLDAMAPLLAEHGRAWVTAAVTSGQYDEPDGLYFGGERTEASTRILERIVHEHLAGATTSLFVDLHTGHGAFGTATLLSPAPFGSPADRWLRERFDPVRIEATAGDPDATSAPKTGQLISGMASMLRSDDHRDDHHVVTFELGTVGGTRMILAERAEHWVHRHGDRSRPDHAAAVWEHRVCSTPDDTAWETGALVHGRTVLGAACRALDIPLD